MHSSRRRPPPPWERYSEAPLHPLGTARRRFPAAGGSPMEPPPRYRRAFDGAGERQVDGLRLPRRRMSAMDRLRRHPVRHGLIGLGMVGAATPLAVARANQMRTDPAHERTVSLLPEVAARPFAPLTDAAVGDAWRDAETEVSDAQTATREEVIARNMEKYSSYDLTREMAEDIYDIALEEEIDPDVAFGLVRTESSFKNTATSHVGAIGLTQLMPATARWIRKDVTVRDLRDSRTNLQIGFKYLRDLLDKYDEDTELALLAYNRGPGTVDRVLRRGGDPDNGYPDMVLRGAPAHP